MAIASYRTKQPAGKFSFSLKPRQLVEFQSFSIFEFARFNPGPNNSGM